MRRLPPTLIHGRVLRQSPPVIVRTERRRTSATSRGVKNTCSSASKLIYSRDFQSPLQFLPLSTAAKHLREAVGIKLSRSYFGKCPGGMQNRGQNRRSSAQFRRAVNIGNVMVNSNGHDRSSQKSPDMSPERYV